MTQGAAQGPANKKAAGDAGGFFIRERGAQWATLAAAASSSLPLGTGAFRSSSQTIGVG